VRGKSAPDAVEKRSIDPGFVSSAAKTMRAQIAGFAPTLSIMKMSAVQSFLSLILPNADLALLVVWSFLAEFSERLVPSILQSAEGSIRDNAQGARR
jgi:hypothetical protein